MGPKIIVVDDSNQALREMAAQAHILKGPEIPIIESAQVKEERAAGQRAKMENFFSKLNGKDRRRLRQACARVSGKKETFSEISRRLSK